MIIAAVGNKTLFNILETQSPLITWIHCSNYTDFFAANAEAFFDFNDNANADYSQINKPVFINNCVDTLSEMNHNKNIIRVHMWTGFIEKNVWEISGVLNEEAAHILQVLNKKPIAVKDEPGFVSARIIAMIINEAYFALEDGVSSQADIDTAMKLGTNYPYGPFEWSKLIGLNNIAALLTKLSLTDDRYSVCDSIKKELN